ncbi:KpsF/GutQ family sugar-phosphate isomerase [Cytophagaceae bacterium ABcell3]|nr:KpsF/GutQ family sugar-phosphate isomerase [Cytophagaceae bacterium ABcell3]
MKLAKNINLIARNVLINEADAIRKLVEFVDEDFERCVEAILKLKGRVVVTGIGKSAIIASKIVATLNSTGTPAVFMHAADAIHGDLGMVLEDDMVICISKSGNTSEIKVLVPLIRRTKAKMVALVGNKNSYLAKNSDFVLNASVEREACPHNLAPTTSTTAALALGDALAVCLIESRNFTSRDFATYHPGGALGKKLYLKVSDIYPQHELPLVKSQSSVRDVIVEISSKRLGATAVVDEEGELCGIITDGDLRRMLNKFEDMANIKAVDIMTANPRTIEHDEYAVNALNMMQGSNITQLVVVKNRRVVGFIHIHDLLKEGLI